MRAEHADIKLLSAVEPFEPLSRQEVERFALGIPAKGFEGLHKDAPQGHHGARPGFL